MVSEEDFSSAFYSTIQPQDWFKTKSHDGWYDGNDAHYSNYSGDIFCVRGLLSVLQRFPSETRDEKNT